MADNQPEPRQDAKPDTTAIVKEAGAKHTFPLGIAGVGLALLALGWSVIPTSSSHWITLGIFIAGAILCGWAIGIWIGFLRKRVKLYRALDYMAVIIVCCGAAVSVWNQDQHSEASSKFLPISP